MKSRFRTALLVVGLILLACIAFHGWILGALGSYLVQADPPEKADVAVVLAGDGWGNRILAAAQLERDGYVPKVIVSGPNGAYGRFECDLAIPFAVSQGYPEAYFAHLEHHARSTFAEAQAIVPEIRRLGYKRVLIVTSDYHTRRSRRIFHSLAPDLMVRVIAAPDESFTADGWWHSREGQKTFLMEFEKTVANWFGI